MLLRLFVTKKILLNKMYMVIFMAGKLTKKRRQKLFYIYLIIIFIITFFAIWFFEWRVRPIINEVAASRAKSVAVKAIANVVSDVMIESDIDYGDLVSFQKNDENNVTAVTSNIVEINKLKSKIAIEIEKKVSDIDVMTTKIPLGNLLNQSLFSGLGPKIKIKMVPLGYAGIDVKNEFSSAGINQTKHEIYLEISLTISVLLPISSKSTSVVTQIPVAETIIVGMVPATYTNVEGQENPEDTVLNILPDGD